MACVTLKRSLELEPLYSPTGNSAKRRRCTPLTPLFTRRDKSSENLDAQGKIRHRSFHERSEKKIERIFAPNSAQSSSKESSPFTTLPMPSNDDLYNRIRSEWKRLKRRRQLKFSKDAFRQSQNAGSSSGSDNDDSGRNSPPRTSVLHASSDKATVESAKGALFTLDQVVTICNKLLVDRDNTLREEYDRALTEKLAEQYDAFVKFTHDQIQSRLSHSASYVS